MYNIDGKTLTPSEMVDYSDVLNSVKLLVEIIEKPVDLEQYES